MAWMNNERSTNTKRTPLLTVFLRSSRTFPFFLPKQKKTFFALLQHKSFIPPFQDERRCTIIDNPTTKMHQEKIHRWQHTHSFGTEIRAGGESKVLWVIIITLLTMIVEIAAGKWFGSMALLADGWHMGTHAAALGVTFFAYFYARRHSKDPRFSFGTGKVNSLGGFASSIGLGIVAIWIFFESAQRFFSPTTIRFNESILVAILGLVVNLVCAWVLWEKHDHHENEMHAHPDHNLRGAYFHVLADALTSLLAIFALTLGKYAGWNFLDPAMGIVGSLVIIKWSLNLLRNTSWVLLDAEIGTEQKVNIQKTLEADSEDRVSDLHIWRVGPKHLAAIISIVSHEPKEPTYYKKRLENHRDLVHITVEVSHCPEVL